jgi:hypothetical protein
MNDNGLFLSKNLIDDAGTGIAKLMNSRKIPLQRFQDTRPARQRNNTSIR